MRRKIGHPNGEGGEAKMAKNERTSSRVSTLASKVLSGEVKPTPSQAKTLAASVLTQAPDKTKKR